MSHAVEIRYQGSTIGYLCTYPTPTDHWVPGQRVLILTVPQLYKGESAANQVVKKAKQYGNTWPTYHVKKIEQCVSVVNTEVSYPAFVSENPKNTLKLKSYIDPVKAEQIRLNRLTNQVS